MFRRRPFVRPLRRALAGDVPPALRRANELMAAGQYAAAAPIFEQFGQGALQRGGPRAPIFFLQAGRARLFAGQTGAGVGLIKKGLSIFIERGQLPEAQRAGGRAIAELKERGLQAETGEIEAFLGTAVPGGVPAGPAQVTPPVSRPLLPTQCPSCGAPVRSDEVDWVDDVTAECLFCGGAVRAEN